MHYFFICGIFFSDIVILNKTNYYNTEKIIQQIKKKKLMSRGQFIFSPVNYNNDNGACILLSLKTSKLSNRENV